MVRLDCGLRGARKYCSSYPGWCCGDCPARDLCDRACRNTPERCGYAVPRETCHFYKPSKIMGKEGIRNGG